MISYRESNIPTNETSTFSYLFFAYLWNFSSATGPQQIQNFFLIFSKFSTNSLLTEILLNWHKRNVRIGTYYEVDMKLLWMIQKNFLSISMILYWWRILYDGKWFSIYSQLRGKFLFKKALIFWEESFHNLIEFSKLLRNSKIDFCWLAKIISSYLAVFQPKLRSNYFSIWHFSFTSKAEGR